MATQVEAGSIRSAGVKSADRTIDLIEHVAHAAEPPSAQRLSEALGIPASSLSYLLGTLVARGWLEADGRAYRLGPALPALLGSRAQPAAERAAPIVRWIRMQLDESCGYFEAQGGELVALISDMGRQALNYSMRVGQRGPLHAFAAGKALLAFGPENAREAYLATRELTRFTDYTLVSRAALRKDLAAAAKRGFARAEHEHTLGLISVAVPVGKAGQPTGAISVAVPSVRFDDVLQARALELLRVAQERFGD